MKKEIKHPGQQPRTMNLLVWLEVMLRVLNRTPQQHPVDWPTGGEFKASLLTCTGHSVTPKWNQSDVTDNIPDLPPFTK